MGCCLGAQRLPVKGVKIKTDQRKLYIAKLKNQKCREFEIIDEGPVEEEVTKISSFIVSRRSSVHETNPLCHSIDYGETNIFRPVLPRRAVNYSIS